MTIRSKMCSALWAFVQSATGYLVLDPVHREEMGLSNWKGEPHLAFRTRPHEWSTVFLLVLTIVVVTALSGIGISLLFNDGMQVSSEKPDAADPSSDARARELLQVHRHAVAGR